MGTVVIILAIILFLALSVLRARLVMERCQGWKERLGNFIKFPMRGTKRLEIFVAIGQLTALFWIIDGFVLESQGFQDTIHTAASPSSVQAGLLVLPLLVFLMLVAGIALKEQ